MGELEYCGNESSSKNKEVTEPRVPIGYAEVIPSIFVWSLS
jgi:hypothetical protein